ncbi:MAG: hypothetical protein HYU86_01600 [Chloroflexi bacterium]|nr:hypothetical protein [Chloroflexota bacterium]
MRIVYQIDEPTIYVLGIGHRREIYE